MSLYKQLSDTLLINFFIKMNNNIRQGILSKIMSYEINLIKTEIEKREIAEIDLNIYQEHIQSQYK
ncbi:hypothetical protein IIU_07046 [Bacillus cereus VD133]|uniref:Uncharacterized protein n=1 Tax=Bacillus cereus VD133 TaxID=1053233 RepID=A0A9W5UYV3_BACCE|nr:hypothetical protein IIU_07046 [Bacillus cereus VD133]